MRNVIASRAGPVLGVVMGALTVPSMVAAQSSAATAPAQSEASARDPAALSALERVGASLRKLGSFTLKADTTTEQVLTSGQKLQYAGTLEIKARKPDRLRLDTLSDNKSRSFYYNGKSLTLFAPKIGYWGTVSAPPTIKEMLQHAQEKYDLEFPLADLFDLGQDPALTAKLTSAFHVGPEHIGDHVCDQFAMRQPNVDWQIWVRQGADALPCKMVITDTRDPAAPQYTAVLHWNTEAAVAESEFTFQPPENARRIVIGSVNP